MELWVLRSAECLNHQPTPQYTTALLIRSSSTSHGFQSQLRASIRNCSSCSGRTSLRLIIQIVKCPAAPLRSFILRAGRSSEAAHLNVRSSVISSSGLYCVDMPYGQLHPILCLTCRKALTGCHSPEVDGKRALEAFHDVHHPGGSKISCALLVQPACLVKLVFIACAACFVPGPLLAPRNTSAVVR